jgi:hypothetical protein
MVRFLIENWRVGALSVVGSVLITAPAMAGGQTVPIPEPGTLALMAGGAAAIFILRRRRK